MFGVTVTEVLVLGVVGLMIAALVAFVTRKPRTRGWVRPRRAVLPFGPDEGAKVPGNR